MHATLARMGPLDLETLRFRALIAAALPGPGQGSTAYEQPPPLVVTGPPGAGGCRPHVDLVVTQYVGTAAEIAATFGEHLLRAARSYLGRDRWGEDDPGKAVSWQEAAAVKDQDALDKAFPPPTYTGLGPAAFAPLAMRTDDGALCGLASAWGRARAPGRETLYFPHDHAADARDLAAKLLAYADRLETNPTPAS
jgi:hypothetical protein